MQDADDILLRRALQQDLEAIVDHRTELDLCRGFIPRAQVLARQSQLLSALDEKVRGTYRPSFENGTALIS